MSRPRVQEGFASIEQTYGSTNRQRKVMAYVALRAEDLPTAKQLFARIGDDWDETVWKRPRCIMKRAAPVSRFPTPSQSARTLLRRRHSSKMTTNTDVSRETVETILISN
jgi:hypothetical protein